MESTHLVRICSQWPQDCHFQCDVRHAVVFSSSNLAVNKVVYVDLELHTLILNKTEWADKKEFEVLAPLKQPPD
jgi:hypothetical protein